MADFIHLFEFALLILLCVILFRVKGLVAGLDESVGDRFNDGVAEAPIEEDAEPCPVEEYLMQANQRADELNDGILGIENQFFASRGSDCISESVKVIDQAKCFIEQQIDNLETEPGYQHPDWAPTISCFLIGAADFMGKQASYCEKTRIDLIQQVLQEDRNYSDTLSQASYDEAFLEENIHIARAGARAAKMWLKAPANSAFNLTTYLKEWHAA